MQPDMATEVLHLRGIEPAEESDGSYSFETSAQLRRVFECEFCVLRSEMHPDVVVRIFDAHRSRGKTHVRANVVSTPHVVRALLASPPLSGAIRYAPTPDGVRTLRTRREARDLTRLRSHWDDRYSRRGRRPLVEPSESLVAWLTRFPRDRPMVLLGDGEGRNIVDFLGRDTVCVELSRRAIATLERRLPADARVCPLCGDMFRWMLDSPVRQQQLVAVLNVGPFTTNELARMVDYFRKTLRAGGACYLELSRFSFSRRDEQFVVEELDCVIESFHVPFDGTERLRISMGGLR